ncbi:MAG: MaoC family dehydratase N-terminal domain-containing protein [Actinomycetota bacterium]|nr:MaoC family dehydratase N-terminal domain-containing protein [Actinomycetota bacterium]
MALNPEFIGRTYPAGPSYVVGREKIREFARAVGDDNPAYLDPEAAQALGYPDVIAPPTFAIVLSLDAANAALFDPELGLDYSRVVHGEQSFSYTRPICAGDELIVTTVIENIRSMAGNDMVTTKGIITTVDGEPVATATSMLVSRGEDA